MTSATGVLFLWVIAQYKVDTHELVEVYPHVYMDKQYCEIDRGQLVVDGETYAICQPYPIDNELNPMKVQP